MLVSNHAAVARFAARGCGRRGDKPVSAPLSDPTARPNDEYVPAVDAALRRVCAELLSENGAILFISLLSFIYASASAIRLMTSCFVYRRRTWAIGYTRVRLERCVYFNLHLYLHS